MSMFLFVISLRIKVLALSATAKVQFQKLYYDLAAPLAASPNNNCLCCATSGSCYIIIHKKKLCK